jgi:hypothetical protein
VSSDSLCTTSASSTTYQSGPREKPPEPAASRAFSFAVATAPGCACSATTVSPASPADAVSGAITMAIGTARAA